MTARGPAGRFLHFNLNTRDIERSTAFYRAVGNLSTVMRTEPIPTRGEVFGVEGIIRATAHFLYDHRGPRRSPALELVQWVEPPTSGTPYADPRRPGLHALCLTTSNPPLTAANAAAHGGTVVAAAPTTIRPGDGVVVLDPDGVQVELAAAQGPPTLAGVRLHCTDIDASISWYEKLGFLQLDSVRIVELPGAGFRFGGVLRARTITLALPEDSTDFVVCLMELLDPVPAGVSYAAGPNAGLFRSALRVEDIQSACDSLRASGIDVTGPKRYNLAGTQVGDMKIAFVTDPDGVLAELIERPAHLFS